ncbi:hypothetical protein FRC12_000900 [Ceratobasidium sp. 428]|nr:hypothetical protein FRC12_000900 [Ceratobasidium sp. 428]
MEIGGKDESEQKVESPIAGLLDHLDWHTSTAIILVFVKFKLLRSICSRNTLNTVPVGETKFSPPLAPLWDVFEPLVKGSAGVFGTEESSNATANVWL